MSCDQREDPKPVIGIIGGSGLERGFEGFRLIRSFYPETPFGYPSAPIKMGMLFGERVVFLPRHGEGHTLNPSEVPYRANAYAFKELGVERALCVTTVGSLDHRLKPGDLAVANQFVDATCCCLRPNTFFEKGIVAHVAPANPVCPDLTEALLRALCDSAQKGKKYGIFPITVKVIEGPRFSTRAESRKNRCVKTGINAVGETAMPEALLWLEARICATYLVVVTDDDCCTGGVQVSAEVVAQNMIKRKQEVAAVVESFLKTFPRQRQCSCNRALDGAIMTDPAYIKDDVRKRLYPIIGDILPPSQSPSQPPSPNPVIELAKGILQSWEGGEQ
jgi:5'-methylthioadenosine phosphorylase